MVILCSLTCSSPLKLHHKNYILKWRTHNLFQSRVSFHFFSLTVTSSCIPFEYNIVSEYHPPTNTFTNKIGQLIKYLVNKKGLKGLKVNHWCKFISTNKALVNLLGDWMLILTSSYISYITQLLVRDGLLDHFQLDRPNIYFLKYCK